MRGERSDSRIGGKQTVKQPLAVGPPRAPVYNLAQRPSGCTLCVQVQPRHGPDPVGPPERPGAPTARACAAAWCGRADIPRLLPALALLLGALGLFATAPANAQTPVWSATLTAKPFGTSGALGCHNDEAAGKKCSESAVLSDDDFEQDGVSYSITMIRAIQHQSPLHNDFTIEFDKNVETALADLYFCAGSRALSFSGSLVSYTAGKNLPFWHYHGDLGWSEGAAVSLSIGSSCPSSADATLSGLTATSSDSATGTFGALTLSPAFAASTTSYTANVANNITHVKLTPTVNDADASVEVGKQGRTLAAVGSGTASDAIALGVGDNPIAVKVTAEDGGTTETYTVTVRRAPPTWASVDFRVTPGDQTITVSWDTVPGVDRVFVRWSAQSGVWHTRRGGTTAPDSGHCPSGGGAPYRLDGSAGSYVIENTWSDGTFQAKTALVNGTEVRVQVGWSSSAAYADGRDCKPEARDRGTPSADYRGNATEGTYRLFRATPTSAPVPAGAELTGLAATQATSSGGPFTPLDIGTFAASTASYAASVGNGVTHVKITPTVAQSDASVEVGKQGQTLATVSSGSASAAIALAEGANPITVKVTAQDGQTTGTYTVTVTRAAATLRLKTRLAASDVSDPVEGADAQGGGIVLVIVEFSPRAESTKVEFELGGTATKGVDYTIDDEALTIQPQEGGGQTNINILDDDVYDPDETITIRAVIQGTSETSNQVELTIKDDDAAPTQSTDATLSGLTATQATSSSGPFTSLGIGTFAASATSYAANVDNSVTHVKLTPTVNHSAASVEVGKSGQTLAAASSGSASAAIALAEGANPITVKVTAEDGATTKTYTVTVTREAAGDFPGAPAAPTLVTGDAQIEASWTEPDDGGLPITQYSVDYKESGAADTFAPGDNPAQGWVPLDPVTSTMATITGLTNGTSYDVRVAATNSYGTGEWSETSSATPQAAGVTVSQSSLSVAEGATATYTVVLRAKPVEPDVRITPTSSAPAKATVSGPVHFTSADWQQPREITVTGVAAGTSTITHKAASNDHNYDGISIADVSVTVTEAGAPNLTLSAGDTTPGEGNSVTVTAELSQDAPTGGVDVTLTAAGGSTATSDDYTLPAKFRIAEGARTKTAQVVIARDGVEDDGETLVLGATAGGYTVRGVTLTIGDTTEALRFQSTAVSAPEGSAAVLTVTRTPAARTVSFTVTPSAESGDTAAAGDFESAAVPGTLASESASATVTLPTTDDAVDEDDETFTATLTVAGSTGYRVDGGPATVTIIDDDALATGCAETDTAVTGGISSPTNPTALAADCSVLLGLKAALEGDTGDLNWNRGLAMALWDGVNLNAAGDRVEQLRLARSRLGGTIPPSLNDLAGLAWLELEWNRLTGGVPDLSALTGLTRLFLAGNDIAGGIPATLGSLTNLQHLALCETKLAGSLPAGLESRRTNGNVQLWSCLAMEDAEAVEGEDLRFDLTHSTWPVRGGNALALSYRTEDGTATGGEDFEAETGGSVPVPAVASSDTSATASIVVETFPDSLAEGPETLRLKLLAAGSTGTGSMLRRNDAAVGTIRDSEPPTVKLSAAPNPVTEGSAVTVTVELSPAWPNSARLELPVRLTLGSAEREDITLRTGNSLDLTVTFPQNAWRVPIEIGTNDDADEDDERFTVALGELPATVTAGSPTSVDITIRDGDRARSPGGGGGGGGGGGTRNRAPEAAETIGARTLQAGASVEVDLSGAFDDPDGDDLTYEAASSDTTVATAAIDGDTLTVRGVGAGTARITVTATDPDDAEASQTFTVTVEAARAEPGPTDGLGTSVWLFASASDPLRQGFARVLNHSDASGTATVTATDDAGRTYEPLTLALGPGQTAPFNSDDLESGNAAKGLAGGTGTGTGGWRFEVESDTLDVEALGYLRTADGFVTAMVATAPADEDGTRRVAAFNPASNVNQVSLLRLVNPHDEDVEATVAGVDDAGRSPGRPVALTVPAGTACTVDAAELESGRGLDCGSPQAGLGDGAGKWRLAVESDPPLVAMSLLSSPAGHLTNLSGVAAADAGGVWHAHLFPAASDPLGRQGFMRVRSRSDERGSVAIVARDDTDREYETLTLALGAGQTRHFNSDDLELGNAAKGLTGSTGSGTGTWRLALSSDDVEFEAHAYIRTSEGFLTAMNASAPTADRVHRVAVFNPGSNRNQVSILRLVNPGTRSAAATVAGTDDSGARPGTTVRVLVPAGDAVELTAAELESGEAAAITAGALGDGKGKWRLRVEASRDIVVLSLLSSPTGHLTNLSRAGPARVE